MDRFDEWGSEKKPDQEPVKAEEGKEAKADIPKGEEAKKADEPEAKTDLAHPEPEKEKDAKKDGDDDETDEVQKKVKGLERELFKKREKLREARAREDEKDEEIRKLRAEKELNLDDFDSYEDFERAKEERAKPAVTVAPVLFDAVADLNKKIEKAGLNVEEVGQAIADMEYLPEAAVISLADRDDGAILAKWLADNEGSELAEAAIRARTDIGRERAFDKIAAAIEKGSQKKAATQKSDEPVEVITRLPGSEVQVPLEKLSTDAYIERRRSESSGPRGVW
ncbi:MAG TPA: hypothetical protein VEC93_04925 [Anaerolineae bacterium]|nr:hypothetical protein [Anaerolineae bacterium]